MITFTTKFASDNIDKANGVIKNVSLISIGQVQGHSCWADQKTLATVLAAAKKAKKLKCKIDHGSSVNQICGSLTKFRLSPDGQKVLGDLKLLKSCPSYAYVLELAEQLSGQVALSIAFNPEFESGANGQRLVRCVELYSADLVSDAAANPDGLFDATPVVGGSLVNTATSIPTGHEIKGTSVGAVCPQCEATTQFLSKLVTLHDNAANHLEQLCSALEPKDNVSSVPTEQQFQARLNAQRLELEKGLEAKASVMASRMLASTGVKLARIPDADTCMTVGPEGILTQLESITNETEKGKFYQRHKQEIQIAFQRMADKKTQLENQARAQ